MRLPWKTKTAVLLEERDFLRAQVAQLQNYILMTGHTRPDTPFPTFDVEPPALTVDEAKAAEQNAEHWLNLAMSEPEEDIEWARQSGDITDSRAGQLLRELQLGNPDET